MEIIGSPKGSTTVEDQPVFGWSGGKQVRWRGPNIGDAITFGFPVETAGTYKVRAVFTRATQYAIVKLSLNDKTADGTFDMYSPDVEVTEEIPLGTFTLHEGQNTFTATIVGKNPKSGIHNMFGIDYLILER